MAKGRHAKILVIKLGALGDFIQALGPMAAIRRHHPKAKITLLTTRPFRDFAEKSGYFDEIWIDTRPRWLEIPAWIALRRKINAAGFDRVYDLQNNDRTALYLKLLSGPRKPEWVGAAGGASHRNDSPYRTAAHSFDGHVQTLSLAGIQDIEIDRLDWVQADLSGFALKKPYVLLAPGSTPGRPQKRWPAKQYARLAKILAGMGFQPVLLGTLAEADVTQHIVRECVQALDLTAKTTLFQIAVMARDAAGAIGNDTGPMHLIAATGCPSTVLFSEHSNPVKHSPKGAHVTILQEADLADLKTDDVLKTFRPREEPTQTRATMH